MYIVYANASNNTPSYTHVNLYVVGRTTPQGHRSCVCIGPYVLSFYHHYNSNQLHGLCQCQSKKTSSPMHTRVHFENCGSLPLVLFHQTDLKTMDLDWKTIIIVDHKTIECKRTTLNMVCSVTYYLEIHILVSYYY